MNWNNINSDVHVKSDVRNTEATEELDYFPKD